jgi:hypothetical protein
MLRIPTFSVFGDFFMGGVYRRPVRLGLLFGIFRFRFQNFSGGEGEVRLPRDFLEILSRICFA